MQGKHNGKSCVGKQAGYAWWMKQAGHGEWWQGVEVRGHGTQTHQPTAVVGVDQLTCDLGGWAQHRQRRSPVHKVGHGAICVKVSGIAACACSQLLQSSHLRPEDLRGAEIGWVCCIVGVDHVNLQQSCAKRGAGV